MTHIVSGSTGNYCFLVPQTQQQIKEAWDGYTPFICFHRVTPFAFEVCVVVPRELRMRNINIQCHEYQSDETGETVADYYLSFNDYTSSLFGIDSLCPMNIPIAELPFDLGLLIRLVEESYEFQKAMSNLLKNQPITENIYAI